MNKVITYSLRCDMPDSDGYYTDINTFTDDWIRQTVPCVQDLIDGFRATRRVHNLEDRLPASCAFDLLVLGVILQEHSGEANQLTGVGQSILSTIFKLQRRWKYGEGLLKTVRGVIYQLMRNKNRNKQKTTHPMETTFTWLRATGEEAQAERLDEWSDFFQDRNIMEEAIVRLLRLASDFSTLSMKKLGKYTSKVDVFLKSETKQHRWRYDATLRRHTRLEYHLAMLGNAILNSTNRQEFLDTAHKIVILPPCMRAQPEEKCKAISTEYGERCTGCTPTCRIHQVTKLGEKNNFDVFIIPDELRVFGGSKENRNIGVIGVSCLLTNWTGGWDVEQLNIPAQGVLLDYVGCKYHWDPEGFPTDINIKQLISIIG